MSNIQVRDFSSYTDFLPLQFSDSDNLIKLLAIYLDQVEELNKAQQELSLLSTNISTATGYQLDIIGNLLGARREGRLDSEYRNYIRFRISINTGSGTPKDVIGFLQTITKATKIRYWEHYPAAVVLETNGSNIPDAIPDTLDNVSPAGVSTGGVIVVRDNYAFRPCRLADAYSTTLPVEAVGMGTNREMGDGLELAPSEAKFAQPDLNTLIGQSVLPNLSEAYSTINNLAGKSHMLAGLPQAQAASTNLTVGTIQGRLATILTSNKNK